MMRPLCQGLGATMPGLGRLPVVSAMRPAAARGSGGSSADPRPHKVAGSVLHQLCSGRSALVMLNGQRNVHTAAAASGAAAYGDSSASSATASGASLGSASSSSDSRPRVCILGGGFGGLYTAIKLELLMWPKGKKPLITLVDQGERFIFKPLLYELLTGTAQSWEVAPPFSQLLAPYQIQFVQDKVLQVQPDSLLRDGGSATGGSVLLGSGQALPYDWLVVALGAAADPRGVPGVAEHARPFVSLEDAEFVAGRLAAFEARAALGQEPADVVVVGAGYAGVELASVVAERLGPGRVTLLTPGQDILDAAPAGQREAARQALQALGVNIRTDSKVSQVQEASEVGPIITITPEGERMLEKVAENFEEMQEIDRERGVGKYSPERLAAAAAVQEQPLPPPPPPPSSNNGSSNSSSNGSSNGTSASGRRQGPPYPGEPYYLVQLNGSGLPPAEWKQIEHGFAADLVLWTAGSRAASQPLAPFATDARGQLPTDATLRVAGHSRVFALGDVARGQREGGSGSGDSSSEFYPATAQVAFQQADYAAWNIWSAINGRALLPFRYQHLGDMMSLGALNAAVALPLELPPELASGISSSPLGSLLSAAGLRLGGPQQPGVTLEGPLAQLLRRAAYLYRQPTQEQRLNVAASWVSQAADAAARLAAQASSTSSGGSSSSK